MEKEKYKNAYFAGGCFWGLEDLFRKISGVVDTEVGYMGGEVENPTYENHKGHAEAVKIVYDPAITSFKELLHFFFRFHNPTTLNRQGNDIGDSYRSAIFYQDEKEKKEAEDFINFVNKSGKWQNSIVTKLELFRKFWKAEEYHQDYLVKNPNGYTCHQVYFDKY